MQLFSDTDCQKILESVLTDCVIDMYIESGNLPFVSLFEEEMLTNMPYMDKIGMIVGGKDFIKNKKLYQQYISEGAQPVAQSQNISEYDKERILQIQTFEKNYREFLKKPLSALTDNKVANSVLKAARYGGYAQGSARPASSSAIKAGAKIVGSIVPRVVAYLFLKFSSRCTKLQDKNQRNTCMRDAYTAVYKHLLSEYNKCSATSGELHCKEVLGKELRKAKLMMEKYSKLSATVTPPVVKDPNPLKGPVMNDAKREQTKR